MSQSRLDGLAIGLLVFLSFIWGINQVAIKLGLQGVSPITQAAIRSVGATVLLVVWMLARRQPLFPRDGTYGVGILSGLLFAAEFLLLFWGMEYTSAARSVVFIYTSPFIVAIGNHFFVPGDELNRQKAIGLVCAFVGVLLAFFDSSHGDTLLGDALILVAAVFWGATTVVVKSTGLRRLSAESVLLYQLFVSAVVLVPCAFIVGEAGIFSMTPIVAGSVLFQIAIVAFASYLAWFWLIREYPASHAAAFGFLTPFFGVAAAYVVLSDPVTPRFTMALTLVGFGIYLVSRSAHDSRMTP